MFPCAGIPIVQLVAGPRVSTSTDEGFALALTETGDVYSWGKGYKGRLGHQGNDNLRAPKLVEAFASLDITMVRILSQVYSTYTKQKKTPCEHLEIGLATVFDLSLIGEMMLDLCLSLT